MLEIFPHETAWKSANRGGFDLAWVSNGTAIEAAEGNAGRPDHCVSWQGLLPSPRFPGKNAARRLAKPGTDGPDTERGSEFPVSEPVLGWSALVVGGAPIFMREVRESPTLGFVIQGSHRSTDKAQRFGSILPR